LTVNGTPLTAKEFSVYKREMNLRVNIGVHKAEVGEEDHAAEQSPQMEEKIEDA
jgi:hypothetical protein